MRWLVGWRVTPGPVILTVMAGSNSRWRTMTNDRDAKHSTQFSLRYVLTVTAIAAIASLPLAARQGFSILLSIWLFALGMVEEMPENKTCSGRAGFLASQLTAR